MFKLHVFSTLMQAIKNLSYLVHFNNALEELSAFLDQSSYSQVFILSDTHTTEYCLPILQLHIPETVKYDLIEIDAGEENKTIDYCIGVWRTLLDFGADRKSLLINLGGGVVTDMGAFAASTYKRGIDFVHVPTTLLAQVDASVGGKTGVDIANFKNIVGTFSQPQSVYIDIQFLNTLPEREIRSGFAEMIKHGLIFDKSYFDKIKTTSYKDVTLEMVYQSVLIKNEVVTKDPIETGLRKILNFGHTIGHAVESSFLKNPETRLLHGEAIAIGMLAEAYLSNKIMKLPKAEFDQIVTYICGIYPLVSLNNISDLIAIMQNDKKNQSSKIGFALLNNIGKCEYDCYVDKSLIVESLEWVNTLV